MSDIFTLTNPDSPNSVVTIRRGIAIYFTASLKGKSIISYIVIDLANLSHNKMQLPLDLILSEVIKHRGEITVGLTWNLGIKVATTMDFHITIIYLAFRP